jgi:hypothetical protein
MNSSGSEAKQKGPEEARTDEKPKGTVVQGSFTILCRQCQSDNVTVLLNGMNAMLQCGVCRAELRI